jgi:hypothetical protein
LEDKNFDEVENPPTKICTNQGEGPFFCVLQGADGKLQKSMIRTCLLVLMLPSLGAVAGLDRTLDA